MTKLEQHRQTWQGKSDEWLFERLANELTQKTEEIHNLLNQLEQVKKCDLADVVKPKGTLCLYESGDTTSARCIHCGREKWEHKRA